MHPKFCIVSDFPSELHSTIGANNESLAHNEHGPSHLWRDGFAVWSLDGVQVPRKVVLHPEQQTLEEIEGEENTEVRRIRIERYGWERYLEESEAEIQDTRHNDRDAQEERLYRLSDESSRFVCVDPSTGRRYALGVPRGIRTCEEAQRWMSHGLDRFAIHRS